MAEKDYEELLVKRYIRELFESTEFGDALICHYFPQYTLEQVQHMTSGDARQLLNTAQRIEVQRGITGLMNASASQSKEGFTKLMRQYEKQLEELQG